ncbi:MAG: ester cyclase, partial [Chromatocurvus sp.]
MEHYAALRRLLQPLRACQYDYDAQRLRRTLAETVAADATLQLFHPVGTLTGPDAFYTNAYEPLAHAVPDLERRDTIVLAGPTAGGHDWVGCCGYYTGTFTRPWLDIPPTGHFVSLRFHEFYRVVDGQVVEAQLIWDVPEMMMQAGAWPMVPSLGREWHVPGPATEDGLAVRDRDPGTSAKAFNTVLDMCQHLGKYATEGVAGMRLEAFWHPRCSWY